MDRDLDAVYLARMTAVAEKVANASHAQEGLAGVIQAANDIFRAQTTAILMLSEGTGHLQVRVSRGLSDSFVMHFRRAVGSGILAEVVLGGMALLLSNAPANRAERDELRLENDFGSAMVVPITINDKSVGCLYVDHRQPGLFSREDMLVCRTLSFLAALALEKVDLHEKVSRLAIDDPVTGLFAYSHFLNRLTYEVARAVRYDEGLAVLVLEVRNLTEIEQSHGRAAAEEVLGILGAELKEHIRGVDFAAAFGPDQLIVALVHADEEGLAIVAERICDIARKVEIASSTRKPSGSVEVDLVIYAAGAVAPEHGKDSAGLIKSVQDALVLAKARGAGQLVMFEK
jgi:diguanylate cyclase (GGDEF)-like protein